MPQERSRIAGRHRVRLRVELLEDRSVPSVYTPSQIRHAYGFDQITFANGAIVGDGSGQTIAIVDAYDDPFIFSDLHHFDQTFGLPDPPSFVKAMQVGTRANAGWAGEIALDVEWAHAIAPGANLLLVEARSSSLSDLLSAVDYAASQPGVSVVSMSWGAGEFSSEHALDSHFVTPAGHRGVTFVASAGDDGSPPIWPAVSPNVLSVGGTSLHLTSSGNYLSETGWSGSGGGVSRFESKPGYQTFVATGNTSRTNPDVAYNADPNTGVYVYDSFNGGWFAVGGTSAGAPQWAALVAIADEGRAIAGKGSLDGPSQTLYALYRIAQSSASTYFHDETSGNNGFAAKAGYDDVTGNGSPVANRVVSALVGWAGTGATGSVAPVSTAKALSRTTVRATRHAITTTTTAPSPNDVAALALPVQNDVQSQNIQLPAQTTTPIALGTATPTPNENAPRGGTGTIFEPQLGASPIIESPQMPLPSLPNLPLDDAVPFDWGWFFSPSPAAPPAEAKPPAGSTGGPSDARLDGSDDSVPDDSGGSDSGGE